jgi:hypothetical protein
MVHIRSNDVGIQQFAALVNEQKDVISKVEIGNETRSTERSMEVKNGERKKNFNSREVSNNNKTCPICLLDDHKPMQLIKNKYGSQLKITDSVSVGC